MSASAARAPVVLRAERLGKRYSLGGGGPGMLREALMALPRRLLGRAAAPTREVWALRDCSFEVRRGEVVGIIGPNGAGKSTLLKVIARITRPTEGFVEVDGRVGSLLEVGTGFHPELTGHENILLGGVMLGMSRRDVLARLGEIVEFSGVDRSFLDTPVKHYSSGMQMRLAFAVAAHLEPDILIVDEVLAVGDAQFQERCLGRMGEAARSGRTVLFVSHNMAAIRSLCADSVVLRGGRLTFRGSTERAIQEYLGQAALAPDTAGDLGLSVDHARLVHWTLAQPDGSPLLPLRPARLAFVVEALMDLVRPSLMFQLLSPEGLLLFSLDFQDFSQLDRVARGAQVEYVFHLERLPLIPGSYSLQLWLKNVGDAQARPVQQLVRLEVADGPVYREHPAASLRRWYGPIAIGDARVSHREVPR